MTARKRKVKKERRVVSKGRKDSFIKFMPYTALFFVFLFLIYRLLVLINFKVDCSDIPAELLSNNNAVVNTLFVFEKEQKIEGMEVVTYSKDQKRVLRVEMPTDLYVTEEDIDSFPISSLSAVGEFLEHGSGRRYTVEYIGNLLGLKFDNYVWLDSSNLSVKEFRSKLSVWSILFDFGYNRELKDNLYSNLPILNLIKEINFLNQVLSNYQYEEMDILDCCTEQMVISDNHKELRFHVASFDKEFSKYILKLVSRDVERERVNVEVYNASDESGLASEYARKIRHTGGRILRFDNSPNIYPESILYVPEPESYRNSLDLIRDVVGGNVKVVYDRPKFITTGDIVLVLGQDLAK